MPQVYISPIFNDPQFFDNLGNPLAGGKIYTYLANTTTPYTTYTTSAGTVANTNPIVLDSSGYLTTSIWLEGTIHYKFVLTDANDIVVKEVNDVTGVNDIGSNPSVTLPVWINTNAIPVYVNGTTFQLPGDWGAIFNQYRRVKYTQIASDYYGRIDTCVVTQPSPGVFVSTITIVPDTAPVNFNINTVYYSILDSENTAVPYVPIIGLVPVGGIIMWSGTIAAIPPNYALCDGNNGTPDLRNRFVIGAGGAYNPGVTGGSAVSAGTTDGYALTVADLPAHSHNFNLASVTGGCGVLNISNPIMHVRGQLIPGYGGCRDNADRGGGSNNFDSAMTTITNTGSNQAHSHTITTMSIMPPYYALAFIMRVS